MRDPRRFKMPALLNDALEQLAGRASRGREDHDLQTEREREARAKDGDAAKRTGTVSAHASEWRGQRAHENVLPNRRGVEIKTSLLLVSQP